VLLPKLGANLLSVSKLIAKGYFVVFDVNGCKVLDDVNCMLEGEVKATASNIGGIYRLDVAKELAIVTLVNDSKNLWHKRPGHLNRISMNLLKNGMVTCIDFAGKSEQEQCIPCLQRKMCRKPFKSSQRKRAKEKLELLHSDLCGAMPVSSWNGANYMFTLVDDYTKKNICLFPEKIKLV
jgi:hypothetical protein